jgi:ABC-type amino acid transport substrate-binding protein
VGRIVGLIFIPFAAWFYGASIEPGRYLAILGVGTLGAFGKPVITIPVLLNIAELPNDIFNLFVASGVIAARFGDLMKCMHLIAFTVLVSCILSKTARPNWIKLLKNLAVAAVLTILSATGIQVYLHKNFQASFAKDQLLTRRELVFYDLDERPLADSLVSSRVVAIDQAEVARIRPLQVAETRVQRISDEGILRIGFDPQMLPFSYLNADGQLVGFDIDMVHFLAYDLIDATNKDARIAIEFVPYDRSILAQQLKHDVFDIAISAVEGTMQQAASLPSIDPYLEVTLALVVRDHDKHRFQTRQQLKEDPNLRLAVIKNSFFAERVAKVFPETAQQTVFLDSAEEYFESAHEQVDGLVISAEAGSAWTLRYPQFTVTNPVQGRVRVPLYYVTDNDTRFEAFLQNWLTLRRNDGTIDELFEYWILGKDRQPTPRRWSLIRALGWVD